ncbi:MAG: aldo/keto reductase, partial [Actinomycetota bacterium]|nr:aldo/keto reductase [Actinomycetota bacterium]
LDVDLEPELIRAMDQVLEPVVERDPARTESPATRP